MMHKYKGPITISFIITLLGIGLMIILHNQWSAEDISVSNPLTSKVNEDEDTIDLKSIIHETEKSVIQVEAQNKNDTLTGSGFLYNDKGDIITNAHVVKDANVVYVQTANAHIYPAAIIGLGETTDIALLRVPQLAGNSYLSMDLDEEVDVGDEIIALGSPHGFQNTVTLGIISGMDRGFSVDGYEYDHAYQISAQITNGNSGGPLISRDTGNVIGINSVGTDDGTIGFSMPLTDVIEQIEQWSDDTEDDQIKLASTYDITPTLDEEKMIEDSQYIIDYFFDSINVRDYVTAYTLLSSTMQTEIPYKDFRDDYIHIIDLSQDDNSIKVAEDGNIKAAYSVALKKKLPDEDTKKEVIDYEFEIGLENDQFKITKMKIIDK